MIKTQVYIPAEDNINLLETARILGIRKSEALRQAVHKYCQRKSNLRYQQLIQKTAGILKDSPLDAKELRRQSNAGFSYIKHRRFSDDKNH